tara:strand:- start:12410 stop:12625 length:216 start_codon:yes stop_codon:yes gene_type:complete
VGCSGNAENGKKEVLLMNKEIKAILEEPETEDRRELERKVSHIRVIDLVVSFISILFKIVCLKVRNFIKKL